MGPHHTRLGRERFGLRSEAGGGVRGFERGDGVGYEEGEKKRRRRSGASYLIARVKKIGERGRIQVIRI
jgi:hypothetical protein